MQLPVSRRSALGGLFGGLALTAGATLWPLHAAHAQFRQTFAKAKDKLQNASAGALVARQVHGELVAWITNHILKIDVLGLRACARA